MTRYDIQYVKGDSWETMVYFKDADSNPINISGDSLYFTIKCNPITDIDASGIYQQVVTSHVNALSGISKISFPAATGANIPVGAYSYDVVWGTSAGAVTTLLKGKFYCEQDITLSD